MKGFLNCFRPAANVWECGQRKKNTKGSALSPPTYPEIQNAHFIQRGQLEGQPWRLCIRKQNNNQTASQLWMEETHGAFTQCYTRPSIDVLTPPIPFRTFYGCQKGDLWPQPPRCSGGDDFYRCHRWEMARAGHHCVCVDKCYVIKRVSELWKWQKGQRQYWITGWSKLRMFATYLLTVISSQKT